MKSAVILAGGQSRRMGSDKLMMGLDGETLLESAVKRYSQSFEKVYISVADGEKYPEITAERIVDHYSGAGPLSGLEAALEKVPDQGVFLVAADMPYSDPITARRMIELCGGHEICVIRHSTGKLEPLFGYYKKALLGRCIAALESGNWRMSGIIDNSDTRYVAPEELGALWNEKLLLNINLPEDYNNLTKKMEKSKKRKFGGNST